MSHFIYWSKKCPLYLLVEKVSIDNMSVKNMSVKKTSRWQYDAVIHDYKIVHYLLILQTPDDSIFGEKDVSYIKSIYLLLTLPKGLFSLVIGCYKFAVDCSNADIGNFLFPCRIATVHYKVAADWHRFRYQHKSIAHF